MHMCTCCEVPAEDICLSRTLSESPLNVDISTGLPSRLREEPDAIAASLRPSADASATSRISFSFLLGRKDRGGTGPATERQWGTWHRMLAEADDSRSDGFC